MIRCLLSYLQKEYFVPEEDELAQDRDDVNHTEHERVAHSGVLAIVPEDSDGSAMFWIAEIEQV